MRALLAAALLVLAAASAQAQSDYPELDDAFEAYLEVWRETPFHAVNVTLVNRQAAFAGDIEARGNNTFEAGEPILVYIQPRGYAFDASSDGVRFGVRIDMELQAASGQPFFRQDNVLEMVLEAQAPELSMFVNFTLNFNGPDGPYIAMLTLTDIVSGDTVDVPVPFEWRN